MKQVVCPLPTTHAPLFKWENKAKVVKWFDEDYALSQTGFESRIPNGKTSALSFQYLRKAPFLLFLWKKRGPGMDPGYCWGHSWEYSLWIVWELEFEILIVCRIIKIAFLTLWINWVATEGLQFKLFALSHFLFFFGFGKSQAPGVRPAAMVSRKHLLHSRAALQNVGLSLRVFPAQLFSAGKGLPRVGAFAWNTASGSLIQASGPLHVFIVWAEVHLEKNTASLCTINTVRLKQNLRLRPWPKQYWSEH